MKKVILSLIVLYCAFTIGAADKSYTTDKILVYGYENAKENEKLLEALSKKGIPYVFIDLSKLGAKRSELEEKIRIFNGKGMNHSYPVVDVNGFIVFRKPFEKPIDFNDIKPFLNRNLSANKRSGQSREINALDLKIAITDRDQKMVELLLASGTDPNTAYRYECYDLKEDGTQELKAVSLPFLLYVYENQKLSADEKIAMISLFLDAGANPEALNRNNESLLDQVLNPYDSRKNDPAFRDETIRLASSLIEHGADANKPDKRGNTPLFHATSLELYEIIPLIVAKGGDINHENYSGENVIMYIPYIGRVYWREVADTLLGLGADINHADVNGQTMLYKAADCPDVTITTSKETDGKKSAEKTTVSSTKNDSLEFIEYLISKNADVNRADLDGYAPLHVAQQAKAPGIVDFLKSKGAVARVFRCEKDNSSPLCMAVKNKDIDAISKFGENDFEQLRARTSDGVPSTPLHLAVEIGDIEFLKDLCGKKVNWNVSDRYRRTPLFLAVSMNRADIVDLLCENGADPNADAWFGTNPYSIAAVRNPSLIARLARSGKKPSDSTPLIDATMSGNIEGVKTLYPYLKDHEDAKNPRLAELASGFGYSELVRYLATVIPVPKEQREGLIAKTDANRDRFKKFDAEATGIDSVTRKSGGIAGKKGAFKYTLEEWSPFAKEEPSLDLEKLPVSVFVPDGYDGTKPFGIMVYMSGGQPTAEYRKIMEAHNIIWVGFNCYSIDYKPLSNDFRHDAFALAAAYNVAKYYSIDSKRVYLSGMSWGGRLTGRIIVKYPHVFTGGIAMGGCQPDYIWDNDGKAFHSSLYRMQNKSTLVFCAGDTDYNRDEAYGLYDYCLNRGFKKVYYLQEYEKGHAAFSGEYFEKAVNILDTNVNK